ncbi:hypothetical protein V6B08_17570 [Ferrovibrio sp. MS7]|uniref:hypothetical protein n=1 Tax=Ferrovibrio plantarum TaxID=3119164 RepID=UPI0031359F06
MRLLALLAVLTFALPAFATDRLIISIPTRPQTPDPDVRGTLEAKEDAFDVAAYWLAYFGRHSVERRAANEARESAAKYLKDHPTEHGVFYTVRTFKDPSHHSSPLESRSAIVDWIAGGTTPTDAFAKAYSQPQIKQNIQGEEQLEVYGFWFQRGDEPGSIIEYPMNARQIVAARDASFNLIGARKQQELEARKKWADDAIASAKQAEEKARSDAERAEAVRQRQISEAQKERAEEEQKLRAAVEAERKRKEEEARKSYESWFKPRTKEEAREDTKRLLEFEKFNKTALCRPDPESGGSGLCDQCSGPTAPPICMVMFAENPMLNSMRLARDRFKANPNSPAVNGYKDVLKGLPKSASGITLSRGQESTSIGMRWSPSN